MWFKAYWSLNDRNTCCSGFRVQSATCCVKIGYWYTSKNTANQTAKESENRGGVHLYSILLFQVKAGVDTKIESKHEKCNYGEHVEDMNHNSGRILWCTVAKVKLCNRCLRESFNQGLGPTHPQIDNNILFVFAVVATSKKCPSLIVEKKRVEVSWGV